MRASQRAHVHNFRTAEWPLCRLICDILTDLLVSVANSVCLEENKRLKLFAVEDDLTSLFNLQEKCPN